VGATEDRFFELARARGIRLERQVCVPGLSSAGHLDPTLNEASSPRTLRQLAEIFQALRGDRTRLEDKRAVSLRLDFFASDLDLFIEVDETQHITTDRARTFESYGVR
jgi:hypothetical protein